MDCVNDEILMEPLKEEEALRDQGDPCQRISGVDLPVSVNLTHQWWPKEPKQLDRKHTTCTPQIYICNATPQRRPTQL